MIQPVLFEVVMSIRKAVEFSSLLADCSLDLDDVEYCGKKCIELSGAVKVVFCRLSAVGVLIVSCVIFTCIYLDWSILNLHLHIMMIRCR